MSLLRVSSAAPVLIEHVNHLCAELRRSPLERGEDGRKWPPNNAWRLSGSQEILSPPSSAAISLGSARVADQMPQQNRQTEGELRGTDYDGQADLKAQRSPRIRKIRVSFPCYQTTVTRARNTVAPRRFLVASAVRGFQMCW